MTEILYKQKIEAKKVFISEEKVLPVNMDALKRSLRGKGQVLASPDEAEAYYAQNVIFRTDMYSKGWSLTSQIGIESQEYRKLNREGVVAYGICRDAFITLLPEERSVRLAGASPVIVSNAYFEDSYACLILRADVSKQRQLHYLYTFDKEGQSGASVLAESLRRQGSTNHMLILNIKKRTENHE